MFAAALHPSGFFFPLSFFWCCCLFYCAQTRPSPLRTSLKYNNGNKSARLLSQREETWAWREGDLRSDSVGLFCIVPGFWFYLEGYCVATYMNSTSFPPPPHHVLALKGNFQHLLDATWKLTRRATFTAVDRHMQSFDWVWLVMIGTLIRSRRINLH